MSYYLIIEKESNIIQALLEIDGDYFISNTARFSVKIPNKVDLDFSNYVYTLNTVTGVIAKVPKVSEDTESLITSLEVSFE